MRKFLFFTRRATRRIGIMFLVVIVLVVMGVGWLSARASDFVHLIVRLFGLIRVETWLRSRSVVFASIVVGLLFLGFIFFKEYEIRLLMHKHVLKAVSLGLLFKITWFGVLNYCMHLYAARFLEVTWMKWVYDRYVYIRNIAMGYLKRSAPYRIAHRIKRHITSFTTYRSVLRVAKKIVKKKMR